MSSVNTLPPEVWHEIFDHATYVPGLLDTNQSAPSQVWAPWASSEADVATNKSVHIRTTIIKVCSSWRRMAMRLFCQYIRATPVDFDGDVKTSLTWFRKLVRRFDGESASSLVGCNPTWTIRIDCDKAFARTQSLSRLLQLCRNLRIFNLTNEFGGVLDPYAFVKLNGTFEQYHAQTLRRLNYHDVDIDRSQEYYGDSLAPDIALDSLSIAIGSKFDQHYNPLEYAPPPPGALNSISSLSLYFPNDIPDSINPWLLPFLQHLSIKSESDGPSPITPLLWPTV